MVDAPRAPRPAHGPGSSWDSPEAVARVSGAYRTADVTEIRSAQIDLLGSIEGSRVLDVGCGPGIYARDLALRGASVTALDSAPAMLEAALAEAAEAGVTVETAAGDANDLPFADGTFDAAVLVQVIEYVPDAVGALREIGRVLAPGGRLLVADTDWTSAAWWVGDGQLEDEIKDAWCATKEHPDAGRRIPSWLREAGYEVVGWAPRLLSVSDPTGDTFLGHSWPSYRRSLVASGAIPAARMDAFDRRTDEAARSSVFNFGVIRHAWLARTTGGTP